MTLLNLNVENLVIIVGTATGTAGPMLAPASQNEKHTGKKGLNKKDSNSHY
jgi:hypothetical protein